MNTHDITDDKDMVRFWENGVLKGDEGIMRKYPHPRSKEAISGLASCRGAESSYKYAESFQLVFSRL